MKCQIPEAAEAPVGTVAAVKYAGSTNSTTPSGPPSLTPSSWPTYDLCIWEEQSKCNHLNMYLHIVQECGFSYLRWLLLFNQIRTQKAAHTQTLAHTPAHTCVWPQDTTNSSCQLEHGSNRLRTSPFYPSLSVSLSVSYTISVCKAS